MEESNLGCSILNDVFEKTSSGLLLCPHWALFCASVSSAAVYPVAKQDNSLQGRVLTYSDENVLSWHEGGPRAVVEKCLATFARGINGVFNTPGDPRFKPVLDSELSKQLKFPHLSTSQQKSTHVDHISKWKAARNCSGNSLRFATLAQRRGSLWAMFPSIESV